MELNKTEASWWWLTQKGLILITLKGSCSQFSSLLRCFSLLVFTFLRLLMLLIALGRCLIAVGNARLAENFLQTSIRLMAHPDSILLLGKCDDKNYYPLFCNAVFCFREARAYCRIDQPLAALEVCNKGLEKLPNDISLLRQQGRIYELIGNLPMSVKIYKDIIQLDSMSTEALSCIAVHYFYNHQPEMSLMYYRRVLSMGLNACELYCNIGLCCLYGGQLDLVFSCFQRALRLAVSAEQKADVWYNISFIGLNIGDLDFARRCLRICISLDGGHASALNNL